MTIILSNPIERLRFIRFAVVGFIGAIIDFSVYNFIITYVHSPIIIAGSFSFIAAVLSNYTLNRLWTYRESRSKRVVRQLLEFTLVSLVGLLIRIPTLAIMEPLVNNFITHLKDVSWMPDLLPADFLINNITLAVTIIIVLFWNFFANRYWTFNDVD